MMQRRRLDRIWPQMMWFGSIGAHTLLCVMMIVDRRMGHLVFALFYLNVWFVLGILLRHQRCDEQARFPDSMLLPVDAFYSERIYAAMLIGTACIIAGIQQVCLFMGIGAVVFDICVFSSLGIYACLLYVQLYRRVQQTPLERRALPLFVGVIVILVFYMVEHLTTTTTASLDPVRHPLMTTVMLVAMDVLLIFRLVGLETGSNTRSTTTIRPLSHATDAEMTEIWHIHRQCMGMQQLRATYERAANTPPSIDPWQSHIYPLRHTTIPMWMNRAMFQPIRQQPLFIWDVAITPAELWVFLTETRELSDVHRVNGIPFVSICPVFRLVVNVEHGTFHDGHYTNDRRCDDNDNDNDDDDADDSDDADADHDDDTTHEEDEKRPLHNVSTHSITTPRHDWIYTAEVPLDSDFASMRYFICRLLDTIGHLPSRTPSVIHRMCWDMLRKCILSLASIHTLPFYVQSYIRFRSRCVQWRNECVYNLLQREPPSKARAHAMRSLLSITSSHTNSFAHHLRTMERLVKRRVDETSITMTVDTSVQCCWNHIARQYPTSDSAHDDEKRGSESDVCCVHTDVRVCILVVDAHLKTRHPQLYARWSCSSIWSSMSIPLMDAVRLIIMQPDSIMTAIPLQQCVSLVAHWFAVIHRYPRDVSIQLAYWNSQHLDRMVPWLAASWRFAGPQFNRHATHTDSIRSTPWYHFLWRMHMQGNFGCRRFLALLFQDMPPSSQQPSNTPSELLALWHQCRRFSLGILCTITDVDAGKLPLCHFFRKSTNIHPTWCVSDIVARIRHEQDTCTSAELVEWKVYLVQICWTIYVHNMGDISLREAWYKHTLPESEDALYILAFQHHQLQSALLTCGGGAGAGGGGGGSPSSPHIRSEFAIMSPDFYE